MVKLGVYGTAAGRVRPARRRAALVVAARRRPGRPVGAVRDHAGRRSPRDLKRLLAFSTSGEHRPDPARRRVRRACSLASGNAAGGRAGDGRGAAAHRQPCRVQDAAVPGRRVGGAAPPAPATWTGWAGWSRRMPATTALVAVGALARRRCRPATGSSPSGCCCSRCAPRRRPDTVAGDRRPGRGRGGRADRRGWRGHLRQGVRHRVPGPPAQRRGRRGAIESPAQHAGRAWGPPPWPCVGARRRARGDRCPALTRRRPAPRPRPVPPVTTGCAAAPVRDRRRDLATVARPRRWSPSPLAIAVARACAGPGRGGGRSRGTAATVR